MHRFALVALTLLTAASLQASAQANDTLVVDANAGVSGSINGSPATFLVTPSGIALPVIDAKVADQLALSHSIFGVQARVGAERVPGHTGVVNMVVAGSPEKRRVLWFAQPQRSGFAGVLGPDAVPQSVVTFNLGHGNGTKIYQLPLVRQNRRVGTYLDVGQTQIFIQWDFNRKRSLATAAAAAVVANERGAVLVGKPRRDMIDFGVERPVQALHLAHPLMIGPLALTGMDARLSDYGSTSGIKNEDDDPNEIVVTAKGKKDRSVYTITVGSDDMTTCSKVEFDKKAALIRLHCA